MPPRRRIGRKLLVASIGVASVSYVACGRSDTSTFNDNDSGVDGSSGGFDGPTGNLAAPQDVFVDQNPPEDAPFDQIVANLVPPPHDAGLDTQD